VHRLGEHWDSVLPGHVLHLRYEDLVRDQVGGGRLGCDWGGRVTWDGTCQSGRELLLQYEDLVRDQVG